MCNKMNTTQNKMRQLGGRLKVDCKHVGSSSSAANTLTVLWWAEGSHQVVLRKTRQTNKWNTNARYTAHGICQNSRGTVAASTTLTEYMDSNSLKYLWSCGMWCEITTTVHRQMFYLNIKNTQMGQNWMEKYIRKFDNVSDLAVGSLSHTIVIWKPRNTKHIPHPSANVRIKAVLS